MTLLYRDRPKSRLAMDELHGVLNLLDQAIIDHADNGETSTSYYLGAYAALEILYEQERLDLPDDYMKLLDMKIQAYEQIGE